MRLFHPGCRHALRRSAGAFAATTIVASGLVLGAAAPASAQVATTATISPTRQTRAVGERAPFQVILSTGSQRVTGQTVMWWVRPNTSGSSWVRYATNTTDQYGVSHFVLGVRQSSWVKATFGGTAAYGPATSEAAGVLVAATLGSRAVTEASRHQGAPYQYGAAGPTRFDCSGFTLYVYGRLGKSLPHNSAQQYSVVRHVSKSSMQVGDLIFIYTSSGIGHVGIYAGNGYMWHSPHSGSYVKKAPIYSSSYYVGRVA